MIDRGILIRSRRVCVLLVTAFALSACGSGLQTLQLSDRALMPTARISKHLVPGDRTFSPSQVQTGLVLDGGILGGSGNTPTVVFAQTIIGNQTFVPPDTIETEFDFKVVDVSMRWRHALLRRRFGYDLAGGLSWVNLDFRGTSSTFPNLQVTESISAPGLRLVAGAFWRVFGETSIEAEATRLATDGNFSFVGGHRYSLVQRLGRHVTVTGGYFSWDVKTFASAQSRIEIHMQGPTAGVNFKF